jgi:hypothetical protein
VESAFVSGETQGWHASEPGPQTIRLVFQKELPERENSQSGSLFLTWLERSNVFCLETLGPLGDIELDGLAFL